MHEPMAVTMSTGLAQAQANVLAGPQGGGGGGGQRARNPTASLGAFVI